MHDSFMPLGGGMAMFMIQLGEMLPGGVGSGLYGMVVMALIAVFVAGLMVGRTPEYLGKKVEAREIKLAMLAVLILPLSILGFSAVAAVLPMALKRSGQPGAARPVGDPLRLHLGDREQRLGLRRPDAPTRPGGTPRWASPCCSAASATSSRCWPSPARWPPSPSSRATAGTFPTDGPLFVGLLIGVILIMGGLQFFPALALGPIVEHFQVLARRRGPLNPSDLDNDQ